MTHDWEQDQNRRHLGAVLRGSRLEMVHFETTTPGIGAGPQVLPSVLRGGRLCLMESHGCGAPLSRGGGSIVRGGAPLWWVWKRFHCFLAVFPGGHWALFQLIQILLIHLPGHAGGRRAGGFLVTMVLVGPGWVEVLEAVVYNVTRVTLQGFTLDHIRCHTFDSVARCEPFADSVLTDLRCFAGTSSRASRLRYNGQLTGLIQHNLLGSC